MIHERRRLIPTMIAVIIGVAFVASTLMLIGLDQGLHATYPGSSCRGRHRSGDR